MARGWKTVVATGAMICGVASLFSSGVQAKEVETLLRQCDVAGDYRGYVDCLRSHHDELDHGKNSGMVGAFYALLDEIDDAYSRSQDTFEPMTDIQGKANVYRAWQSTIAAANVHQNGRICAMNGNILVCQ